MKEGVWIGADSAGVGEHDYSLAVRADRKVFRNEPFVMGFTSSFRMGQLLAHKLRPPKRHVDDEVMTYMVTEFIDSVRTCLKEGGFAKKTHEEETAGTFLVGFEGRIFNIEGDYQVGESAHGFHAVGCGALIALGSLHATRGSIEPQKRIELALQAAEAFSAGVGAPFHIESA